jgi:hypothetical protein
MFTINPLGLPPSFHRCLGTTNLIESPQSGVQKRTGNVCRWRDGGMVLRWVAGAYLLPKRISARSRRRIRTSGGAGGRAGPSKKSVTLKEKLA